MNQRGFNLIEVAFSVAIITTGLLVIISLFSVNIKNGIRSKNKLIAVYLANESIEIVRQQRDNSWFRNDIGGWMVDIPTGNVAVVPQDVADIRKGWNVVPAAADSDERKVFLTGDDIYLNNAVTATSTGFERYLTIDTEATGSSECTGFGTECMEVTAYVLFNGVQFAEVTAYFYDGWF